MKFTVACRQDRGQLIQNLIEDNSRSIEYVPSSKYYINLCIKAAAMPICFVFMLDDMM